MCPDYSQFRCDNKYETLIDHQKDEHDIEYSSEFLSQPENESSTSDSECEINYFANDQSSNSDSENKN